MGYKTKDKTIPEQIDILQARLQVADARKKRLEELLAVEKTLPLQKKYWAVRERVSIITRDLAALHYIQGKKN